MNNSAKGVVWEVIASICLSEIPLHLFSALQNRYGPFHTILQMQLKLPVLRSEMAFCYPFCKVAKGLIDRSSLQEYEEKLSDHDLDDQRDGKNHAETDLRDGAVGPGSSKIEDGGLVGSHTQQQAERHLENAGTNE